MKYRMMDLIACPMCKAFPLTIHVFEEGRGVRYVNARISEPVCETFCGYNRRPVSQLYGRIDCLECISRDVIWGALCCPQCKTMYPIVLGVPLMYPTHLWTHAKLRALYTIFLKKFGERVKC